MPGGRHPKRPEPETTPNEAFALQRLDDQLEAIWEYEEMIEDIFTPLFVRIQRRLSAEDEMDAIVRMRPSVGR